MSGKAYRAKRTESGCSVLVLADLATGATPLNPRFDLRNHSTGFEWGYGGSGPAQLSLALCADVLGDDDRALRVYQALKFRLVAEIESDEWETTSEELLELIRLCEMLDGEVRR